MAMLRQLTGHPRGQQCDKLLCERFFGPGMAKNSYDFDYASALLKTKDFARTREYVLPFANEGDSNAQCMMGLLCEHGFGASPDVQEAERWLRKAAEQSNAVAWNNLGTLLLGKGDNEEAKACYRKAVELGFTMAAPLAQ